MTDRKVKKWVTINGNHIPIYEDALDSTDLDEGVRERYSKFVDDTSHDEQLDSDEKAWVEALRKEKYGKEIKPWSEAEQKRSSEMSRYVVDKVYRTGDDEEFYEENFVEDIDSVVIKAPGYKDEEVTLSKMNLVYAQNYDEEDRRVKKGKAVTGSTYYVVQTDDGAIDENCFAYKTKADAVHAMELYVKETTDWRNKKGN